MFSNKDEPMPTAISLSEARADMLQTRLQHEGHSPRFHGGNVWLSGVQLIG